MSPALATRNPRFRLIFALATLGTLLLNSQLTSQILSDEPKPLSPTEATRAFEVSDGFKVELALSEPEISQPVFFNFDERGRLWVMNYLQYPNPAGLKMLSRDKFWRAVYDKVPVAPPNHVRGADKITIHEDTNADGVFDKHKTFVDGLSIATSFARGNGGVWVLNPPYLLFYPDENNDDVPDGDPVVHLEGFGIEDTHSCSNSLRWGPDGWLYAGQGSTVTGNVRKPDDDQVSHSLGQLIWRYHPTRKLYEIFAEGGGNTFGVEFDSAGRVFSGHNGGNTRGFHFVQGGYYRKGFGKHGPLSNSYAFGYFESMKHHDVARFVHNFVIYGANEFPASHRGDLFGVEPMQGQIVRTKMIPTGTTFQTEDIERIVKTNDVWFRPVDIKTGPDGAIYFADFYEPQISHREHFVGQIDRERGRIYRLVNDKVKPIEKFDLHKLPAEKLISFLEHPNKWFRQTALRRLYDLRDNSIAPELKSRLKTPDAAIELFWALNACGSSPAPGLEHANPLIREWALRFLSDQPIEPFSVTDPLQKSLEKLASNETDPHVRSQLMCTLRRIDARNAFPGIVKFLKSKQSPNDALDPHIPMLVWWAIETHCRRQPELAIGMLKSNPWLWENQIFASTIAERLMRRFAFSGTRQDYKFCTQLFELSRNEDTSHTLMKGFELAFKGRPLTGLPLALNEQLANFGGSSLTFQLRQKNETAIETAMAIIKDKKHAKETRLAIIEAFGEVSLPSGSVLTYAIEDEDDAIQFAGLVAAKRFRDLSLAESAIRIYERLSPECIEAAQSMLSSRVSWSRRFLKTVDGGNIDIESVPKTMLQKIALHGDKESDALIKKNFGSFGATTTSSIKNEIRRVAKLLREVDDSDNQQSDPLAGKAIFNERCAKCHKMYGEGGAIGPDLTTYNRHDTTNILINIVNPSAEIREGFENYKIMTEDGQLVVGFITEQDSRVVVVRDADGQTATLERDSIEEMAAQKVSLMPEGLLDQLSDKQLGDLFAFIRSTQPLNK